MFFALITRLLLLFTLYFIVHYLTDPVFHMTDIGIPEELINRFAGQSENGHGFDEANGVSWKDIILLGGGLFLVGKSVYEIHEEFNEDGYHPTASKFGFLGVITQIAILDIIFSLDSVITAVGMVDNIWVMAAAIIVAVAVMLVFAEPVSRFVEEHPTLKMLALSFLILIGVLLIAEGIGTHFDRGYIYFSMAFALVVELLNLRAKAKREAAKAALETSG